MSCAHVPPLDRIGLLTTKVLTHLELLNPILVLLSLLSRLVETALGQEGTIICGGAQ